MPFQSLSRIIVRRRQPRSADADHVRQFQIVRRRLRADATGRTELDLRQRRGESSAGNRRRPPVPQEKISADDNRARTYSSLRLPMRNPAATARRIFPSPRSISATHPATRKTASPRARRMSRRPASTPFPRATHASGTFARIASIAPSAAGVRSVTSIEITPPSTSACAIGTACATSSIVTIAITGEARSSGSSLSWRSCTVLMRFLRKCSRRDRPNRPHDENWRTTRGRVRRDATRCRSLAHSRASNMASSTFTSSVPATASSRTISPLRILPMLPPATASGVT